MDKTYRVRETFLTLQGEGTHAGRRAVFLRFAGCNMWNGLAPSRGKGAGACAQWCDTDFVHGEKVTKEEISHKLNELWPRSLSITRIVVMTGGEPLLQLDDDLMLHLIKQGWSIHIETNGTVPMPTGWRSALSASVHVCVSPKLLADGALPTLVISHADELKVVLPGHVDPYRGWTDEKLRKLEHMVKATRHSVQPQDPSPTFSEPGMSYLTRGQSLLRNEYDHNVNRCVQFVLSNPLWRMGSQTHKLWSVP